jgi:hypothetical protein
MTEKGGSTDVEPIYISDDEDDIQFVRTTPHHPTTTTTTTTSTFSTTFPTTASTHSDLTYKEEAPPAISTREGNKRRLNDIQQGDERHEGNAGDVDDSGGSKRDEYEQDEQDEQNEEDLAFLEEILNTNFVVHDQEDLPEFDWYSQAELDAEKYWLKKREQEKEDYELALKLQQEDTRAETTTTTTEDTSFDENLARTLQSNEEEQNNDDESLAVALSLAEKDEVTSRSIEQEKEDAKLAEALAKQYETESSQFKQQSQADEIYAKSLQDEENKHLVSVSTQHVLPSTPFTPYGHNQHIQTKFPQLHPHTRLSSMAHHNRRSPDVEPRSRFPDHSSQILKAHRSYPNMDVSLDDNFDFDPSQYFTNLNERVSEAFQKTMTNTVVSIDKALVSVIVKKRFVDTWKALAQNNHSGTKVAPVLCFHGTATNNIESILQHGLLVPGEGNNIKVSNGSAYGKGIYLSVDPAVSIPFCKGGNKMFVCACLLGSKFVTSPNGSIIVAFENSHVMPCFVITFASQQYLPPPPTSFPVLSTMQPAHWSIRQPGIKRRRW